MCKVLQNNWIAAPPPPTLLMRPIGAVRQASLDTHAICSTGGRRFPYPCVSFITPGVSPINTHTHRHTGWQLALHTLQTIGKTNTHGGLQLTYIHTTSIYVQKNTHTHIRTFLHNTCAHARTLITHNPPTQKLRRVFPWCRIKELTRSQPPLPLTSPFLHLGAGKHWQLSTSQSVFIM